MLMIGPGNILSPSCLLWAGYKLPLFMCFALASLLMDDIYLLKSSCQGYSWTIHTFSSVAIYVGQTWEAIALNMGMIGT